MCCNFCKPLRVQIAAKFQVSTCNLAIPLALKCLKHESLLTFVESVRLAGVPLFTLRPHPTEIREALQCLRLWFLEFWAVLPLWLRLSTCATQTEKRGTQCEECRSRYENVLPQIGWPKALRKAPLAPDRYRNQS